MLPSCHLIVDQAGRGRAALASGRFGALRRWTVGGGQRTVWRFAPVDGRRWTVDPTTLKELRRARSGKWMVDTPRDYGMRGPPTDWGD